MDSMQRSNDLGSDPDSTANCVTIELVLSVLLQMRKRRKLSDLPKVVHLENERERIPIQVLGLKSLCMFQF